MSLSKAQPATEGAPLSELDERHRPTPGALARIRTQPAFWVAVIDLALIVVFGILSPDNAFLKPSNFTNMALDSAQIVLLGIGVAFLLGACELDISLGANVILSSVVGGKLMVSLAGSEEQLTAGTYPHLGLALIVGIAGAVLTGLLFGLINGVIVTRLSVNSFITTLGTMGAGTGLAYVLTDGYNVNNVPVPLQEHFGVAEFANIPLPALVALLIVLALWWALNRSRFGLHTLAIGSSRDAAARAGLRINRHLLSLFGMAGALAGLAGVFDLARFATTNVSGHQTDALSAIAAAVIGGTNLFGGSVSVWGAVLGALLAAILQTGLVIMGLPAFYQLIAIGVVLIAAVSIRGRRAES